MGMPFEIIMFLTGLAAFCWGRFVSDRIAKVRSRSTGNYLQVAGLGICIIAIATLAFPKCKMLRAFLFFAYQISLTVTTVRLISRAKKGNKI